MLERDRRKEGAAEMEREAPGRKGRGRREANLLQDFRAGVWLIRNAKPVLSRNRGLADDHRSRFSSVACLPSNLSYPDCLSLL